MTKELHGRALCRSAVEDLKDATKTQPKRLAALAEFVCREILYGDEEFGQLAMTLSPVGQGSNEYNRGLVAYVCVRGKKIGNDHLRALRAACRHAGLEASARDFDLGPFDALVNHIQAHFDDRKILTQWR